MKQPGFFILLLLVLLMAGLYLATEDSSGTTITVDDDGGEDYETIQEAVDNATYGDTIRVYQGVYRESLMVNKTLSLVGNGSRDTIVQSKDGPGVKITAPWVNLSGFSIENHGSTTTAPGIELRADNIRASNCRCSGWGYGIHGDQRNFCTLENNTLEDNRYSGIYFQGIMGLCSGNILTNNICQRNGPRGIFFYGYADGNIIRNNSCWGNDNGISILSRGGGLTDRAYNTIIENNTCLKNYNTGILLESVTNATLRNNTLLGNGEGIRISGNSPENSAHNNFISGNQDHGVNASDILGDVFNVTGNWWGDDSGPYHPIRNFNGAGDEVTDGTVFDPWLRLPKDHHRPESEIHEKTQNSVVVDREVAFHGESTAYGWVARHVWSSSLDGELFNGTPGVFGTNELSLGNHSIRFQVQDNYGSWSRNRSMTLVVRAPNRAPTVNITFPGNRSTVEGVVTLEGWATDADGGTLLVEVAINEGQWKTANDSSPWTYSWDTTALENGNYRIRVRTYDGEEYSEETAIEVLVYNSGEEEDHFWQMVCAFLFLATLVAVVLVKLLMIDNRRQVS